ncbi:MAG TPA: YicC family protein [Syntrophobacteraceae bacterium]|nr:YicC family protein [Syntrophobacteraceae bacterium]
MIHSMTAFGRSQTEESGFSIAVEIRALNSRNLDVVLRLPKNCAEFEDHCRRIVAQSARRGRLEVNVQIESKNAQAKAPQLNMDLARCYWEQLLKLHRLLPQTDPPTLDQLLSIPYLFEPSETALDRESLKRLLTGAVTEALQQVQQMKALEGETLLNDCLNRIASLRRELSSIENQKDKVLSEYRQKLFDRIREFLGETQIDENRLIQELALVADRSDINEELVRLHSHLDQMRALLNEATPADGRRLDFLAQEIHREVNTLGSKTGDLEIIRSVITMKTETGKLKEQLQNVE